METVETIENGANIEVETGCSMREFLESTEEIANSNNVLGIDVVTLDQDDGGGSVNGSCITCSSLGGMMDSSGECGYLDELESCP